MKKLFLFVLLFVSLSGMCQVNSFIVSNEKLIWENVFISSETNIPANIARHVRLKIISSENNIYKGTATEIKNTCPGTSDFLKDAFSFDFEIELSDGKYRVSISNLVFIKKSKNKKTGAVTASEKYFIDNGSLKKEGKSEADLTCLDNYFNKIFSMTTTYKNKL